MAAECFPNAVRRHPRAAGRGRTAGALGAVAAAVVGLVVIASPASAGTGLTVVPTFPATATVGQAGVSASLRIVNLSTPPDNLNPLTIESITLVPSCGSASASGSGDCPAPDPGVFQLGTSAVGASGTACGGMTFLVPVVDRPTGRPAR